MFKLYRNHKTENQELIGTFDTKEQAQAYKKREIKRTSSGLWADSSLLTII